MAVPSSQRYDAVVVGGGHNGLVAAAYLARAGRSVCVLERLPHTGGAAVSERPFAGVDARLSRYSYLVSLLPRRVIADLGLRFETRRRTVSSYSPDGAGGMLVGPDGPDREREAWAAFYARTAAEARAMFPTLTQPLRARDDVLTWTELAERPLGELLEAAFTDDLVRGTVLTDALIGTFTSAHDPSLLQNRCFLYHVIGNGTGDWDVPVGGMGALTGALAKAATDAGAEIVTEAEVTAIDPDGGVVTGDSFELRATDVLLNCPPDALLGRPAGPRPEGAQLKVNMVLRRLPRLKDPAVDPRAAFGGTFHIAEGYAQLQTAYEQAARGEVPAVPPSEIYCHTLTDPSILSGELQAQGVHTLTLFGLHMPARLFPEHTDEAVARTLQTLDDHLAEPIADCLLTDAHGRPCLEVRTPPDLEAELGLPQGHIFHRDLQWPWAETPDQVGTWGVETEHPHVLVCGASARRGGGVSGIPGHNAAQAILTR